MRCIIAEGCVQMHHTELHNPCILGQSKMVSNVGKRRLSRWDKVQ